jgi:hypothetical protein
MFHMSSLKMGLDQAVLKGFESGASGEVSSFSHPTGDMLLFLLIASFDCL